ncbi:MAG: hypothetical protein JNL62_06815 [Bryobacterales bacterium]|nr:hypothetical protein [Bryobacterales bacterium]
MKHYSIEKWADYVRGLVSGAERSAMEHHLQGQCAQCRQSVERMRVVQAGLMEKIEVPESFLERAMAIFPRTVATPAVRRLMALLTFDSLGEPMPAGVRGATQETRRLAYAVEDFKIELLAMAGGKRGRVALTGQVSSAGVAPVGPVRLMSKNKVLSSVPASEFGEFQMEFEVRSGLRLVIPCTGRQTEIEVPLDLLI